MAELAHWADWIALAATGAVLNSIWQGLALAAVIAVLLRVAGRNSAATRYAVWLAALIAVAALPLVTGHGAKAVPTDQPRLVPGTEVPAMMAGLERDSPPAAPQLPVRVPAGVPLLLAGLWLVVAAGLVARLVRGYCWALGVKRRAAPLPEALARCFEQWTRASRLRRPVETLSSPEISLPMAAGLVKPTILFPAVLCAGLTEAEACQVWLHEVAHLRRRDDWTNAVQKLVEALLFFHPAVRWIGRRLNLEREIACDDSVLAATGASRPYAACLAKLAELAQQVPGQAAALGVARSRKQIFRRMEMLLKKGRRSGARFSRALFASALIVLLFAAALAARMAPLFALEQQAPATAQPAKPAAKPAPPAKPAPAAADRAAKPPAAPAPQPAEADRQAALLEEVLRVNREIMQQWEASRAVNEEQVRRLQEVLRQYQASHQNRLAEVVRRAQELSAAIALRNSEAAARLSELEQQIRRLESQLQEQTFRIQQQEQELRAREAEVRRLEGELQGQLNAPRPD